ncbi:MAG: aminoacyl-tRNA hydrolase [Verrucomicrobiota bacterium]|nr:aminoacyl-tRNA hydrolase [Verrucomicrobiota bacterium]
MADESAKLGGPVRLIAGLGNPGGEYERTRHNVGFVVVDLLAKELGASWQKSAKWNSAWAKVGETLLVKPLSFMNRSGEPVSAVADFYKIAPAEILLVSDDTALPLGRLRIRLEGSSGGHNGLESIFMHFATDAIPRLRIGIGEPPREGSVDYVLGRFFEEERPVIEKAVIRAVEAVKCAIDKGVVSAMNTFNKIPES